MSTDERAMMLAPRRALAVRRPPVYGGRMSARSFSAVHEATVELQAHVRFREEFERGAIIASGVPRARVTQILSEVLQVGQLAKVAPQHLRTSVHRDDDGRWRHEYGLALAISIAASMIRQPVPQTHLYLGDVGLQGEVRDVSPRLTDALNDAIAQFVIEPPVVVVMAAGGAMWVRSSPTVRVVGVATLAEAVEATWTSFEPRL